MADDGLPQGATWRYPVILACMGEGRAPDRREFHSAAGRIWREYLAARVATGESGRFAALRTLCALTRATLVGQRDGVRPARRVRRSASPTMPASPGSPNARDLPR
ncbi:hypothetical protein FHS95_001482 [Sphingomonas naasensis]|uniref:hypothetical protein n=1 Tax=Sphingomonas naasensis TaxID=1344951 RepID=UPI0010944614|nr:hypothetical protein [Sphingomonas naasensis]NIJ19813.1 hypothetical protein [Sphingomonas naasensis]